MAWIKTARMFRGEEMAKYQLELIDLTKAYKKKLALDHFSYRFEEGIYGLLGSKGA